MTVKFERNVAKVFVLAAVLSVLMFSKFPKLAKLTDDTSNDSTTSSYVMQEVASAIPLRLRPPQGALQQASFIRNSRDLLFLPYSEHLDEAARGQDLYGTWKAQLGRGGSVDLGGGQADFFSPKHRWFVRTASADIILLDADSVRVSFIIIVRGRSIVFSLFCRPLHFLQNRYGRFREVGADRSVVTVNATGDKT